MTDDDVNRNQITLFVTGIIVLAFFTLIAIVTITVARPDNSNNSTIITTIVGVTGPIVIALMAASIQQLHLAVNSRLTELLNLTRDAARAEGKEQGKTEVKIERKAEEKNK